MKSNCFIFASIAICLTFSGCKSTEETPPPPTAAPIGTLEEPDTFEDPFADESESQFAGSDVYDPIERWNRLMFNVNDKIYFYGLKPVATTYSNIVPEPGRKGINNAFDNISRPITVVNQALQGKFAESGKTILQFALDSTVGFFGFGRPSEEFENLETTPEDTGQTLATWGIGEGPYIVWPLLGPSNLRDSVGRVGDHFLNPTSYIEDWEIEWGLRGLEIVNGTSMRIGQYEAIKDASVDAYSAVRNGHSQRRQKAISE